MKNVNFSLSLALGPSTPSRSLPASITSCSYLRIASTRLA